MISVENLKRLSGARLKDSYALLAKDRHQCAVYVSGYSLELALKWKICAMFAFPGFPETKQELDSCKKIKSSGNTKSALSDLTLREIRNHKLNKLLYYSGAEFDIKREFLDEWYLISAWDPESRYRVTRHNKDQVKNKLNAVQKIVNKIML